MTETALEATRNKADELWVGYAVSKDGARVVRVNTWTAPFVGRANRYVSELLVDQANVKVYRPGCWAHTKGTPSIHPNEADWVFVLLLYRPVFD